MRILRRILLSAAGVTMIGGLSFAPAALAGPESTTASTSNDQAPSIVQPLTNPSDGFCNRDELGDVKLGGDGYLYECSYVPGLGYYWLVY